MNITQIEVGKTYTNKGAGRTRRTVIAIGDEHRPVSWHGAGKAPNEPGVLYEQGEYRDYLYLSSFASWAGGLA